MTLGLRRHGWGSETQLDRAIFGVGLAIGVFALGLAIGVLSPALPPAALLAAITIRRHHRQQRYASVRGEAGRRAMGTARQLCTPNEHRVHWT